MADGPFVIKVKMDVTAGSEKAFTELSELNVNAMCVTNVVVAASSALEVPVMPEIKEERGNFRFLLVRPTKVGADDIKPEHLGNPEDEPKLEYATTSGVDPRQRKPIRGSHTFVNGQTEWITDMIMNAQPGGLKTLWFWNNFKKPEPTEDMINEWKKLGPAEGDKKLSDYKNSKNIALQIIAGYVPVAPKAPDQYLGKQHP